MLKKLKQRIDQYLSVNWLRPETLLWDVPLSLLVDPYLKQKGKKLEVGIGNGINSFVTLGGKFYESFDSYSNLNSSSFLKSEDIYNTFKQKRQKIIKKYVKERFDLVIDHKQNLLKQAKLLNISKKYIKYDCNNVLELNNKFDLVYSNILYWLNNPFFNLKNFNNILNPNGILLFILPNENFYKYCKSYKSKEKFWKLLNLKRNKHYNFNYKKKDIKYKLNKMNCYKIINIKSFFSKKSCNIWDVGTRLLSSELIRMTKNLNQREKMKIKINWCKKLYPLIYHLVLDEIRESNTGAFDLYILKKVK